MQAASGQAKQLPLRGLKQVKVDNWGTFFLQRLQQLYYEEELLDLTIKFPTSDITVQAHRLVITTCTDYFTILERQQKDKDENFDGVLVMPPDMPYECVKSIISFMYTGQLEYWTSEQNALYRTAQKMNMTVLTKLLDARFNTSALQANQSSAAKPKPNIQPVIALPKPTPTPIKKATPPLTQTPTLPAQPLPGRKLPIWKRKLDTPSFDMGSFGSTPIHKSTETTPGPSRFDLPEVEDFALGVFSSFDDITYNTKPIVKAPNKHKNCDNNSLSYRSSREDDGDTTKNDTTEDEDEEDQGGNKDSKVENSDDDWTGPKGILRPQETQPSPSKKVRFDLEEKENLEKSKNSPSPANTPDAINNHAKIIREVLKKYPHLVKNNKNIRLKIMQKEVKSEASTPAKTKVSYVVLKSDHLMCGNNSESEDAKPNGADPGETGPWKCHKCDIDEEYVNYYMYRRHMQDVHEEKFDPRVCEHCGYKATKRNILMYHLYTKHNVPPPKSMCFPKCHACSYVALSETLLVRHQINHKHRPSTRQHSSSEEIQCMHCTQTFKDVTELASHEINTGHGNPGEGREKGHRCPHCGKTFVRATNLQVHLDCAHKDLLRDVEPAPAAAAPISLEPSSEAEALSHVASGIAASLGVGDAISPSDQQVITSDGEYVVPEMQLTDIAQSAAYNGQEIEGQQMIMLIDNGAYQQHEMDGHHPQPQQIEVSSNEQIVMQGTEDGMIVYIHGNEDQGERQVYTTDQSMEIGEMSQVTEEIVEEVVEEVEEEMMDEEGEHIVEGQAVTMEDDNIDQVEEEIQYVEEETEIVEYDEEQCGERNNDNVQSQESVMIIEEEHVEEGEEVVEHENGTGEREKIGEIADDWDDDGAENTEES